MGTAMNVQDATLAMAASVIERSRDLIDEGWVKGTFYQYTSGGGIKAPKTFCILGALELAAMELFEGGAFHKEVAGDVLDVARYFILDEIASLGGGGSIPGFNDAGSRTHEQVLSVLDKSASRLWNLSIDHGELGGIDLTRYVDVEPEEDAQAFLSLVLA